MPRLKVRPQVVGLMCFGFGLGLLAFTQQRVWPAMFVPVSLLVLHVLLGRRFPWLYGRPTMTGWQRWITAVWGSLLLATVMYTLVGPVWDARYAAVCLAMGAGFGVSWAGYNMYLGRRAHKPE